MLTVKYKNRKEYKCEDCEYERSYTDKCTTCECEPGKEPDCWLEKGEKMNWTIKVNPLLVNKCSLKTYKIKVQGHTAESARRKLKEVLEEMEEK